MKKAILLLGMASLIAGCQRTTFQTSNVTKSGFLQDYSMLKPGADGEAQLIYIAPNVDFSKYDKIKLIPAQTFANKDSEVSEIDKTELRDLVTLFNSSIANELKKSFVLTDQADATTIIIKPAITEAEGASVAIDTISTILPIGLAVSAVKRVSVGTHTSVGLARGEVDVLDAVTNERLAAGVDELAGKKLTGRFDKFNEWRVLEEAFQVWAERMHKQLVKLKVKTK